MVAFCDGFIHPRDILLNVSQVIKNRNQIHLAVTNQHNLWLKILVVQESGERLNDGTNRATYQHSYAFWLLFQSSSSFFDKPKDPYIFSRLEWVTSRFLPSRLEPNTWLLTPLEGSCKTTWLLFQPSYIFYKFQV